MCKKSTTPYLTLLIFGWLIFNASPVLAQKAKSTTPKSAAVTWVSYDLGLENAKKENKPIMVDFYTSWCGWCKKMDKETFAHKDVSKLLSQDYVAVKLNAESSKKLKIGGQDLTERDVAKDFKVTGYPTICFLKADGDKIGCLPGYAGPEHFVNVLSYIKDKAYEKNIQLQDYIKQKEEKKSGS
jgi:thioredoxin-related protein